jgi:hypothetical protein
MPTELRKFTPLDDLLIDQATGNLLGIRNALGNGKDLRTDAMSQIAMGVGQFLLECSSDALTATPGGGQAGALQLTSQINRLTVVATAGDSAKLPAAVPGLDVVIVHHGINAAQVFGLGTDQINDVAAATGVSQMPFSTVLFFCTVAGLWYTECLATGFSGGFATQSFAGPLTAKAGGGQALATPLLSMVNRFGTVATLNDSALLPVTVANISIGPIVVANAGVAAMNVFPAGTDQINVLGASAAFSVPSGKTANFYSTGLGQWHALLSA